MYCSEAAGGWPHLLPAMHLAQGLPGHWPLAILGLAGHTAVRTCFHQLHWLRCHVGTPRAVLCLQVVEMQKFWAFDGEAGSTKFRCVCCDVI